MRRTRFMTWFFLVLSLAFLLVHDFRVGLGAPLVIVIAERPFIGLQYPLVGRLLRWFFGLERYVTPEELRRLALEAARHGDTEFLAFAALNLPKKEMRDDIFRFCGQAMEADPSLTWVIHGVGYRFKDEWGSAPFAEYLRGPIDKLQAFDPDNAVPHLMRAELIRSGHREWPIGACTLPENLTKLAKETEWRRAMEAAFASPRYDTYAIRRFELERKVMREHGWSHPAVMGIGVGSYPVPDLLNLRYYTNLLVCKFGAEAEASGQLNQALGTYQQAALFGERMHLQSRSIIERLSAIALRMIAYERLAPALRKSKREIEATRVETAFEHLRQGPDAGGHPKDPLARSSNYNWSVLLVNLSAALVLVFFSLTMVCVGYVNTKRWIRTEKRGRLYQVLTAAENYVAILLFLSSLALYVSYAPYAQNFSHYMTAEGPIYDLEPLLRNSLPVWGLAWPRSLPLENPFQEYAVYALAGIALLVLVSLVERHRSARKKPVH